MNNVRVKNGDLPQEFVEPDTLDQVEMLLGYRPKTVNQHKVKKVENPQEIGLYDNKSGYWKYKHQRAITPKRKVMASLLSFGFNQTETQKFISKPSTNHKYIGHTSMVAKSDAIKERVESNVEAMVAEAKEIIQKSAVKAAENFQEAVLEGDMKASGKVLEFCGAFRKQSDVDINVTFGAWLKTTQEDRAIDVGPERSEDIVCKDIVCKDIACENIRSEDICNSDSEDQDSKDTVLQDIYPTEWKEEIGARSTAVFERSEEIASSDAAIIKQEPFIK